MQYRMDEPHFANALNEYLTRNGYDTELKLSSYPNPGCTLICFNDEPVLIVTEPNPQYFHIEQTENTKMLLRKTKLRTEPTAVPARTPA